MKCKKCGNKNVVKNGKFRISGNISVQRFYCRSCGASFRKEPTRKRIERRGRRMAMIKKERVEFKNVLNYGFIYMINSMMRVKNKPFYKLAKEYSGLSRSTLSNYLKGDTENIDQDFLMKVFLNIKKDIESEFSLTGDHNLIRVLKDMANEVVISIQIKVDPTYESYLQTFDDVVTSVDHY